VNNEQMQQLVVHISEHAYIHKIISYVTIHSLPLKVWPYLLFWRTPITHYSSAHWD